MEHELVEGPPVMRSASMAEHTALVGIRPSTKRLFVAPRHQVSQTTQCEVVLAAAAVEIEVAVVTVVVLLWHRPSSELACGKTTDSVEHELGVVRSASLAEHPALVELRLSTKSPLVAPRHQVYQTTQCEVVRTTVPSVAAPSSVLVVVHFLSELLLGVASICEGSLGC